MMSSIEPSSSLASNGKLNRSIDDLISSSDDLVAVNTSDKTEMFSLKSAIYESKNVNVSIEWFISEKRRFTIVMYLCATA